MVDNKPGAFTNLAAGEVARSQPDGYTLLVSGHVTITSNIISSKAFHSIR